MNNENNNNENSNDRELTPEERRAERLRRIKEAQLAANQNKNNNPAPTPHTAETQQLSKPQAAPPGSPSPSSEKMASAGNSAKTEAPKKDLPMERAHKMLIDAAKRGPNKGVKITNADFDPSANGIPHIIFPLPVSGEDFIDIFHTELLSSVLILNQSMAQKLQMLVKLPGASGQMYPPTFNVQAALDATLPDNYIKVAYPQLDEKGNGEIISMAFYITSWPELFGLAH